MILALSAIALAVWVALAATRLSPLRPIPRLDAAPAPKRWPGVVAVIPARNEEETIGAVVAAHGASSYPGEFSAILVDDGSTDATAATAVDAAHAARLDDRLAVIEAPPLPAGWTGKMNAVDAGLSHAAKIARTARYVLLTDADIALAPATLERLVALAEGRNAALVSLMARLDARGLWGGLLIPAFVYFFQLVYPFARANDPSDDIAAAAGGCMLVRGDALAAIGGVQSIRDRIIDDCALAEAVKRSGRRIWVGIARDEARSLRDNRSLSSIWKMVARTAFAQLGYSWIALAGTVAAMAVAFLAPPVVAIALPWHHDGVAAAIAAAAWALMALTYLSTARAYDQAPWKTFFLPLAALFYTMMTVASALDHARGRGGAWKGRTYAFPRS